MSVGRERAGKETRKCTNPLEVWSDKRPIVPIVPIKKAHGDTDGDTWGRGHVTDIIELLDVPSPLSPLSPSKLRFFQLLKN